MTDLVFLWHMHQPRYVHPVTGRPSLPWVRLHAASGYLDMARALEKHPSVHVTVNFVPSLIEQLEAMLAGAKDTLELLAERPADTLDDEEQRTILARSFSAHPERSILPRARYAELSAKRKPESHGVARRFGTSDLRDLQCLFLLSWLGFAAREDDPAIGALDQKGRDYTEDDKAVLLRSVRRAAAQVLPSWKRLSAAGQVELSTSPYYHPILPLVIDSDAARRARPEDVLPSRFAYPEDAREHIQLAQEAHLRTFDTPAKGMWPSEGSLSPEAVRLYGECGVSWLCGDEETLARSLGGTRAGHAAAIARARSQIWCFEGTPLLFRDRELSDRIGFRYAQMPATQAAHDLVGSALHGGGIVGLFLDGENAWEAYPSRGAEFLHALYGALEADETASRLRTRTVSEAIATHEKRPLANLHSGSWIDAAFRIWIGDPEKNRAWTHLRQARERLAQMAHVYGGADERVIAAKKLLLAAEGSDWFWWFGEPFSSAEDPIFDQLFRAHLEAAWRAMGELPPANLAEPIGQKFAVSRAQAPTTLVSPCIDGRADQFYEWSGAACHDVGRGLQMAEAAPLVDKLLVGFDHERLYLRLVPSQHQKRRVAAAHITLHMSTRDHRRTLSIDAGAADGGAELRAAGGRVGAWDVVELALPFTCLPALPRDEVRFWMTLEFAGLPIGRVPREDALIITVPWPEWEDENWSA